MATAIYDAQTSACTNLLDLVPIAERGIVSKPLLQLDAKVIVFAMDGGQSISEHRAPFVATVHVLDGHLRFTVGDATHDMKANDWLVIPNNAAHDLEAVEPTRFLLTMIKE